MTLPVTVTFPTLAPFPALQVEAWTLDDGVSRLFELTLRVLSTDPAFPLGTLIGEAVHVAFADQPLLPEVSGIVARARQTSAEPTGMSRYEVVVVPQLWLSTRRRGYAIFQDLDAAAIADTVLVSLGAAAAERRFIGSPPPVREYLTLYEETVHDFFLRFLAHDGLTFVVDHGAGGTVVLFDDTAAVSPLRAETLPWDPANLSNQTPAVLGLDRRVALSVGVTQLRDYDADNPLLQLDAAVGAAPLFAQEELGRWYEWAEGTFRTPEEGLLRARRGTEERRAEHEGISARLSHALPPGARLTVTGHPSGDGDYFVLRLRAEVKELSPLQISQHFVVEALPAERSFRPPRRPKPRVFGTQTAVVVSRPGKEIDVDSLGRVEVALRWDLRGAPEGGGTSRRVRVARPWGGPVRGFVAFPRTGDEVVLSFLDGDPDRPLIVGSVHNPTQPVPQCLPGDETVSSWRSASSPGGDGHNEVRMDDAAGAEKLELRAERDYRLVVGRHSVRGVSGNATSNVLGNETITVGGSYELKAEHIRFEGNADIALSTESLATRAKGLSFHDAKSLWLNAEHIELTVGGASITMRDGKITMTAKAGIEITAEGGDAVIKGSPKVKLNP